MYKIERWDVITTNNIDKIPMIYIKPDEKFLQFVRDNKFAVLCTIQGTGTKYDSCPSKIPGLVSRSSEIPNCRANYYDKTGYYVITLLAPWFGYPSKDLGVVTFFGMEEKTKEVILDHTFNDEDGNEDGNEDDDDDYSTGPTEPRITSLEAEKEKTKHDKRNSIIIFSCIGGIILMLLIILIIYIAMKKH